MSQVLELKTPRLALEPLEKRHAALLFELLSDSAIYAFIPQEPPKSVEALAERYERLSVGRSESVTRFGSISPCDKLRTIFM